MLMTFRRAAAIFAAFFVSSLPCATSGQSLPASATEPHRILLTWDSDPANSQAVTWRTEGKVDRPVAQLAPALPGPRLEAVATSVSAVSQEVETTAGQTAHYHTAAFRNLKPSTKYAYRVGDNTTWSEWNHFITASNQAEPFSFLYLGDAQNDVKSLWSRVIRDAFRHGSQAKFILHAGDLINIANVDREWGDWFDAAGWVNRVIPSIAVPGNHEYYVVARDQPRQLSRLWKPQFEYPRNGLPELEDTNYYLDYQGVRIIGLDSNRMYEEQAKWLEDVLQANTQRWTILTFHHPIYSAAARRDNPHLRKHWLPIIEKHAVDLVLQGHDHTYGRSQKIARGTIVGTNSRGTVYVVSVSGPKMYEATTQTIELMARVAEDTQLYQLISIDGDSLHYEARTAAGDLYDAFELQKAAGTEAGNRLINRIPPSPERRRGKDQP